MLMGVVVWLKGDGYKSTVILSEAFANFIDVIIVTSDFLIDYTHFFFVESNISGGDVLLLLYISRHRSSYFLLIGCVS